MGGIAIAIIILIKIKDNSEKCSFFTFSKRDRIFASARTQNQEIFTIAEQLLWMAK